MCHEVDEILSVSVGGILFVLCYRPPATDIEAFSFNLNTFLLSVHMKFDKICILGDFNMPNINWCDSLNITESIGGGELKFAECVDDFGFIQLNTVPSNKFNNILDLVFSNFPEHFSPIKKCEADFVTDHNILNFSIKHSLPRQPVNRRFIYNYKDADFTVIQQELESANLSTVVNDSENVHLAWQNWLLKVNSIIEAHVPKVLLSNRECPEWFDKEVIHLRNVKNTVWRMAHAKNTPAAWAKFKKVRNKLQALIRVKHKQFIANLGESVKNNPKRFWSFVKSKSKSDSIPSKVLWNNQTAESPAHKAELFNKYFASVFKHDVNNPIILQDAINASTVILSDITVSESEVVKILSSLNVNKAVGVDDLSPVVLKECCNQLKSSICNLINRSLIEGTVPNGWTLANVIPIHKGKKREDVQNYRPVSLLSLVSKVAERCIHNNMYPKIAHMLNNAQHGFVNGKSTSTQLVQFVSQLCLNVDKSVQCDIVYTDFSKAFDTVSHEYLILKLKSFGISGNLLNWFKSYLSGRKQRVVLDGVKSSWINVTSGVPQGSILGPLLFLIYINDLPDVLRFGTPLLFADDAKIFANVQSVTECQAIQKDLDALYNWCVKWKLDINALKCKVLSVTKSRSPVTFDYHINGIPVEKIDSFKDLGIHIQTSMSWNNHIDIITAKANRMMGLIKRTVGFHAPVKVKLQLYTTLVRSQLEYCTQSWNGLTKSNKVKIERIQRAATRYILNYPNMSYVERLTELNLLPLTIRRDVLDLKFFYKCLKGIIAIDINSHVNFVCNNHTHMSTRNSSDPSLLDIPLCRTNIFQNSYFNRIVYSWNKLPLYIRSSENIKIFTRALNLYCNRILPSFNPDCCCTLYQKCPCLSVQQK